LMKDHFVDGRDRGPRRNQSVRSPRSNRPGHEARSRLPRGRGTNTPRFARVNLAATGSLFRRLTSGFTLTEAPFWRSRLRTAGILRNYRPGFEIEKTWSERQLGMYRTAIQKLTYSLLLQLRVATLRFP